MVFSSRNRPDSGVPSSLWRGCARGVVLLLVAVALVGGVAAAAGWLSVESLWGVFTSQHEALVALTARYPLISALVYVVAYGVGVTLSLPGAVWMTLLGGYLFGPVWGAVLVLAAATVGAIAVFLLARTAWGDGLLARTAAWPAVAGLADGLRRHAFSTLLAARLVPIFPFWVVNLIPALIGVPLPVFVAATALGIVPGTLIYVSLGAGLADVADQPAPDPALLMQPNVLLPLMGLAVLAMLPVVWRWYRGRRSAPGDQASSDQAPKGQASSGQD